MNVLRAIDATGNSSHVNNPRRIVFLEVPAKALSGNNFLDPWNQQFEITLDTTYDNICDGPSSTPADSVTNHTVVVWSRGPDKTADNDDDVKSWE